MGLIRGSGSFTRFFVNGKLGDDFLDDIEARIKRHSFKRLDENSSEERSTGWVNIMNIYDLNFEGRDFFMHPYIGLSWRVDMRKVPKSALKQQVIETETEIKEREELEYIPKDRRKELKDFLWHGLLKRAIPRTYTYDMIWNIDTSVIFFSSTNNKICDEFSEFFSRTFDMVLSPVFPYSLAWDILEKQGRDTNLLEDIRESIFSGDK